LFQGAVTHEDFEGHRGTIKAGDVQWMTAGRGIVHSEMPAGPGTSKGLQLWVNLSSGNKMYVTLFLFVSTLAATAQLLVAKCQFYRDHCKLGWRKTW
jgi:hypothetical protein